MADGYESASTYPRTRPQANVPTLPPRSRKIIGGEVFTFGIVWPTNGVGMHAPSVVCACALRERRRGRDQPLEISSRKPSAFWMSPSSTSSMKKTSGEFAGIFPFFSSP